VTVKKDVSLRRCIIELEARICDKLLRIDTGGYDKSVFAGDRHKGCHTYHSKGYCFTWRYLNFLKLGPEDVLYDIGCGAGRVLCLASLRRIKRCVGVELSDSLCNRAISNVMHLRVSHAPIEIVRSDAVEADYSAGTVFILYNPFGRDILKVVLAKIRNSVAEQPRHVRFAYVNPFYRELFDRANWLRPLAERCFLGSSARVCYYESLSEVISREKN
jgi:SAM-dependent methyltransferase